MIVSIKDKELLKIYKWIWNEIKNLTENKSDTQLNYNDFRCQALNS